MPVARGGPSQLGVWASGNRRVVGVSWVVGVNCGILGRCCWWVDYNQSQAIAVVMKYGARYLSQA